MKVESFSFIGHPVSMRVFLTFYFVGAFLCIATAQNVTDLIGRLDSAQRRLVNTEKTPSTEDQSEESDENNQSIDSVNNNIDAIQANFKNTSHNKEVKDSLKAQSADEKESDEFQVAVELSTIFSPDISEKGLESVEDGTKGTTEHLRHNKFSQSHSNPSSKTQSSLSSGASASATEPTAKKSSPTSKQPDGNDVVLVSQASPTMSANLFRRGLAWMSDTYTLSIIVPVAAGFIFASVIIVTVAMANCIKRRCRRKRLRRKVLPDSVRRMRPADRARLLAESSDEEF